MTTGNFRYIDPPSYANTTDNPSGANKPWAKVDGPGTSFTMSDHPHPVTNIRGNESAYGVNISGFAVYRHPANETAFTDDAAIRKGYYAEVENVIKSKLDGVTKVVIFDHTIRRRDKNSPRQPVQQVHVDQTPAAAEARVRRHLPEAEAERLLQSRYQLINIWRPIGHPATDFPLAVVDWRTTSEQDFIPVDLLYPVRKEDQEVSPPAATSSSASDSSTSPPSPASSSSSSSHDPHHHDLKNDDRGREKLPDATSHATTTNYQVKGETFAVAPNPSHRFFYQKDMTPEEVMFIKCFDSRSQKHAGAGGEEGVADCTPHTAFIDPMTPEGAKGRQSIEVRCLVFYG